MAAGRVTGVTGVTGMVTGVTVRGMFARALRWRLPRGEAHAILFTIAVKSVVTLAMLLFAWNYAELADAFNLHALFPDALNTKHLWYTGADSRAWYLPLANWDAQHYLLLSDYGYTHGHDRTGGQQFFPLYPLLIRACSLILPRPLAAMLLNYALMAGFALFLHRIAAACGCRWPLLAVLIMLAFPSAFFTSAFYSEALFLFLMAGFVWHFFHTGRRVYLLYFALLPLARGSAVFFFGALVLYALLEYARRRGLPIALAPPARDANWRGYAECAGAFAAGAAAYLAFFYFATGDAFAGLTAAQRWGHAYSILHMFDLPHVWANVSGARMTSVWFNVHASVFNHLTMWFMLAGLALFGYARAWRPLCLYFPQIYAYAGIGFLAGFSRYALVALPFLALVAAKQARRRWQAALICALCVIAFAAQLCLAARFSVNLWVN